MLSLGRIYRVEFTCLAFVRLRRSTETGKEAGDASVPNRAEVQPAAVQQLARTRSQNAPRLGSPSGLNSAAAGDDGVSEKQEVKSAVPVQRSSLRVTKRPRKDASPPPSSSNPPATNAAANKKSAGQCLFPQCPISVVPFVLRRPVVSHSVFCGGKESVMLCRRYGCYCRCLSRMIDSFADRACQSSCCRLCIR